MSPAIEPPPRGAGGSPREKGGTNASWVFDVVSPFAYLAFSQLRRLPGEVRLDYVPVLLAGLLNYFGQVGPAEIPSKRRFTYRFVVWRARRLGLPLRMPPAHPFNSLAAQRLIIAAGCTERAVATVLDAVFREGRDVGDPAVIAGLAEQLGVSDPQAMLAEPAVKQRLRENTEWASSRGIFGVPTLVIRGEFFWGHDAIDMALEYLADGEAFYDGQMQAIETLPIGAERRRNK
jgi:2-hydroxychromene-2-carboxylate isomerase